MRRPARSAVRRPHLSNFRDVRDTRAHAGFGLNDFDESLPGPIEWDVKRLAREHRDRGPRARFRCGRAYLGVEAAARAYREATLEFADAGNLAVWYARLPAKNLRRRLQDTRTTAPGERPKSGSVRRCDAITCTRSADSSSRTARRCASSPARRCSSLSRRSSITPAGALPGGCPDVPAQLPRQPAVGQKDACGVLQIRAHGA